LRAEWNARQRGSLLPQSMAFSRRSLCHRSRPRGSRERSISPLPDHSKRPSFEGGERSILSQADVRWNRMSLCRVVATALPAGLFTRRALLEPLITGAPGLQFNGHERVDGETVRQHACNMVLRAWCPRRSNAPYAHGNSGLWRKSKCLNRQEFVVVGWTDPEGSRPYRALTRLLH
jgi:hypothetical protein